MLAAERRQNILERLNAEGRIIVADLSREYQVTEETIRRDIDRLAKEGLAAKTYGGAIAPQESPFLDQPYNVRKMISVEEKQRIAGLVADMIHDGDRIMLDASSTAVFIIKKIRERRNLTVITNSVEILLELADKAGWSVLCTGGMLKEGSYSMYGASAEKMIRDHHVNMAICSAKGLDLTMGVTESDERDAEIKRAILDAADVRILAMDSTKFNKISFVKVCPLSGTDILVTDRDPGEEWKKQANERGIRLVY